MYTLGPSSPEGAQLTVRGGGFLFDKDFSLGYSVIKFLSSTSPFGMMDVKPESINRSINHIISHRVRNMHSDVSDVSDGGPQSRRKKFFADAFLLLFLYQWGLIPLMCKIHS
jgi:hypothetical protein